MVRDLVGIGVLRPNHEVFHVQTFDRIVNRRVLLLICLRTLEPFQSYNQNGRRLINLDLLDSLLVLLALVAIPFVLPA